QSPGLQETDGLEAAKDSPIQALAHFWQQALNLLASLCEALKGPLPVLFQVPAQGFAFLWRERVGQQVARVAEPQLVAPQRDGGQNLRRGACWWWGQGDGQVKQIGRLAHVHCFLSSCALLDATSIIAIFG